MTSKRPRMETSDDIYGSLDVQQESISRLIQDMEEPLEFDAMFDQRMLRDDGFRRPMPLYRSRVAYLNGRDYLGRTPLMMAMASIHPSSQSVAATMIRLGARVDLCDRRGLSAADYALESGDPVKIYMIASQ